MKKIFLISTLLLLLLAGGLVWLAQRPMTFARPVLGVHIAKGASVAQVGEALQAAGVSAPVWAQVIIGRVAGFNGRLRPGYYEFNSGSSLLDILTKIAKGDTARAEIRLIEGWTFKQIRKRIDEHPDLTIETLGMSDADLLKAIGATESAPEGLFFPATYTVDKYTSSKEVYRRAYQTGKARLEKAWALRDLRVPLATPYEALILASLVEKETGLASDRGKIASVFVNRLNVGMPLQTDPTLIYGLGDAYKGSLGREDKFIDHPYNTYKYKGLPPTPIAAPGDAALLAATQPPKTDYLYFVARGDGSSVFSLTLDQHNGAVRQYLRKGTAP